MNYAIPRIIEDLRNGISRNDVQTYMYGSLTELGEMTGGLIIVAPVTTEIAPVTTGVQDRDEDTIEVILVKNYKTTTYQNASQAGDFEFLTRVMRGKDNNNDLLPASIVYIIRSNFKRYGINESSLSINWNDTRYEKEGLVAATLTIRLSSIHNQTII